MQRSGMQAGAIHYSPAALPDACPEATAAVVAAATLLGQSVPPLQ